MFLYLLTLQVLTSSTSTPPVTTESSLPEAPVVIQSLAIQSNWHLQFNIPELNTFSGAVKNAVRTGVVTGLARREIIQVLWTHITKYTLSPTSEQYVTVCQKLIGKFPSLKGTEGGSSYVSNYYYLIPNLHQIFSGTWRLCLRNSFKNF